MRELQFYRFTILPADDTLGPRGEIRNDPR
jgi:hypothetical protein